MATDSIWELRIFCTRPQDHDLWRTFFERLRQDRNVYSVSVQKTQSPHIIDIDVVFMPGETTPNNRDLFGLDARYPRTARFTHRELDDGIELARFEKQRAIDDVLAQDTPDWKPPPWVTPGRWVAHKEEGWNALVKEVIYGSAIRVRYARADARGERVGGVPMILLASNFAEVFEPAETPRLPKTVYQRLMRGGGI